MATAAEYSGLAIAIPAGVAGGYILGSMLDQRLGTHAWYIVGVILGAVGGLIEIIRRLMRDTSDGGG